MYNIHDSDFFGETVCFLPHLAGMEGIEPPLTVLETAVMPFDHIPVFSSCAIETSDFLNDSSQLNNDWCKASTSISSAVSITHPTIIIFFFQFVKNFLVESGKMC